MYRRSDGSVVVPDAALYTHPVHLRVDPLAKPDVTGALAAVRVTDVLLVGLRAGSVPGPHGVIDLRATPGAMSALWSMAEMLRIAAATQILDVAPQELQAGVQPYRVEETLSARVYLADTLENGAGYSSYLARAGVFEELLESARATWTTRLEDPTHSNDCDTSCPDCLRSYENRVVHPALDWRLALDMLELAAGEPLRVDRWLADAPARADAFVASFPEAQLRPHAGALPVVWSPGSGRAAMFGHPLWRLEPAHWVDLQHSAAEMVRAEFGVTVRAFDLRALTRDRLAALRWLADF
jgi:DEAD/DEAH box helicase domain-containing protein